MPLRLLEGMTDRLNDHSIADIGKYFAEGFRVIGYRGCEAETGLREFQRNR